MQNMCSVQNQIDPIHSSLDIPILAGPLITLHPASKNVKVGEKVNMKCKAKSNPDSLYKWTKGLYEEVNII